MIDRMAVKDNDAEITICNEQSIPKTIAESDNFSPNAKTCPSESDHTAENAEYSINYLQIFVTIISIVFRFISIMFNIAVANEYIENDKLHYFIWTLICIIVPMIATSLLCLYIRTYHSSYIFETINSKERRQLSYGELSSDVIFSFLFRYWRSLCYSVACKNAEHKRDLVAQKKYYECWLIEESNVSLIRIFECFLEFAPQKILQISIILAGEESPSWFQLITIFACFISLTWCIVVYHVNNRLCQPNKEKITNLGIVMQCLWHFCVSVARIMCISFVASLFPQWIAAGCLVKVILTGFFVFIIDRPKKFCSETCLHGFSFCILIGAVYIFTYITLRDGRTFKRFSLYYTACFIENTICLIAFLLYANDYIRESICFVPALILTPILFVIGIIFMIIYYTRFHPNVIAKRKIMKTVISKQSKNIR